jgi:hypothetical protein
VNSHNALFERLFLNFVLQEADIYVRFRNTRIEGLSFNKCVRESHPSNKGDDYSETAHSN